VKEDFLQYVWQCSLYNNEALKTVDGKPIQVIKTGNLNKDAGPDFFNSKLMIDNTVWAGNVEVHITSSEWMQHGHQFDAAYNNVVLHVVYEHNEEIVNQLGKVIPTLELRSVIPHSVIAKYNSLYLGTKWIACENMLDGLDQEKLTPFIHRMFIERLEDKTRYITQDLAQDNYNWEKNFYEYLARNFGFKTNALPFHILAKSISLQTLAKHKSNLLQLEALLFGQAGFLNENFEEEYPQQLKKEYGYLKKAYQLEPVSPALWKFATMRPANFPTIRLAQFAQLVHHSTSLFSRCMEISSIKDLQALFDISLHNYWDTHYQFDQPTVHIEKKLGKSSIENIFMNTIAPFMFAYGKEKFNTQLCERSIAMMESMPAETNGITKNWEKLGFEIGNAFNSQAFIQLKNMYCTPKKCLSCGIGNQILRS
jgi:hypothetical protein